ncbi:MAG TPA: response regulator transcription factor [Armatimonadota bacterium]|jgi:DNA-binding response OmpR family regulator
MSETILIIEDEQAIADGVAWALRQEGFLVETAADGEAGLAVVRSRPPSLIILDLMLPGVSGWEVCRAVRKSSTLPILILTARAEEFDRVLGLELGADDYVSKPFSTREVVARVRAILRRTGQPATADEILTAEGLSMDIARHELTVSGVQTLLSPKEWDLLEILLRNRGRVLTREILLDRVWGGDTFLDRGTLDVHIRWLRQKVELDPGAPKRILTVRGVGYKAAD